jgi:hypothetical protein
MATVTQVFVPESARVSSSGIPELIQVINTGTIPFPYLAYAFDASAVESIYFVTRLANYGASNPTLTLDVDWYSVTSQTTGGCVWGWSLGCYSASTDNVVFSTAKSLATAQSATGTAASSGGRVFRTSIANTANKDSAAADDIAIIRLFRDATNGSDTMTGDGAVVLVTLSYSDT